MAGHRGEPPPASPSPFTRVLTGLDGQLACPMLIGGRLFFLSDHEGTGNIYSCALDGTGITRHTDHDGMYARNPSTDGRRIVYHVAGDIWLLDGLDAPGPLKLDISLGSPPRPGRRGWSPRGITWAAGPGPDRAGQCGGGARDACTG